MVCITQLLKDRKIEELLAAVEECPDVYVILGGKGVLEELVVQAAATNPRILFVGFVSGKQIADYTCAGGRRVLRIRSGESERTVQRAEQVVRSAGRGPAADHGRFRRDRRRGAGGGVRHRAAALQRAEVQKALQVLQDPSAKYRADRAGGCGEVRWRPMPRVSGETS